MSDDEKDETPKELLQLKGERTKAKLNISLISKKLNGAIVAKSDFQCLEKLCHQLDDFMKAFEEKHEQYCLYIESNDGLDQYRTVNGLSLDDYYEQVSATYYQAKGNFTQEEKSTRSNLLKHEITIHIQRLQTTYENAETLIDNALVDKEDIECYIYDMERLCDSYYYY